MVFPWQGPNHKSGGETDVMLGGPLCQTKRTACQAREKSIKTEHINKMGVKRNGWWETVFSAKRKKRLVGKTEPFKNPYQVNQVHHQRIRVANCG